MFSPHGSSRDIHTPPEPGTNHRACTCSIPATFTPISPEFRAAPSRTAPRPWQQHLASSIHAPRIVSSHHHCSELLHHEPAPNSCKHTDQIGAAATTAPRPNCTIHGPRAVVSSTSIFSPHLQRPSHGSRIQQSNSPQRTSHGHHAGNNTHERAPHEPASDRRRRITTASHQQQQPSPEKKTRPHFCAAAATASWRRV
ncbi:hypothetical protein DEO72_LG3g1286 [Vigna unguiculata]|uniref:Uncharacterized protein n=1 Tax=Vigna unguiculata TaxID=3917 RepID=A0A4D6LE59_VIGUN|nr:hypothetical protein DEO72_LG3g1286 [Vigna unguiculata]